jgi:two-component system, OmpR family, phosphate regulon response regulator PhoB
MERAVINTQDPAGGPFASASTDISKSGEGVSARIFIAGGDASSMQPLLTRLAGVGFDVKFDTVENARAAIARESPDLLLLDWDLSSAVAIDLLRHIRCGYVHRAPRIIALSTLTSEDNVLSGFELGVDDYVAKPFSVLELVARARAVLRPTRHSEVDHDYLEFCAIRMYLTERRVTVDHRPLQLRQMEFRLLEFLMRHPERAFSRQTLLERVWRPSRCTDLRAVNVTVQRIRQALAPYSYQGYLQGVRNLGYRLSASGLP